MARTGLVGWSGLVAALLLVTPLAVAAEPLSKHLSELARERCGACHGPGGQGSNPQFPKLSGQNPKYLIQQMFNFKSGARQSIVMEPQLADLSGEDIEKLAAHFSRESLIPNKTPNAARVAAGRKLFLEGNTELGVSACATCHGPKGRGGLMLPRLAGQHAEYLEIQLRRFAERSRTTDQMLMHSIASRMSDQEIRAVSYFLSGLE
jgi:cytochrome c553